MQPGQLAQASIFLKDRKCCLMVYNEELCHGRKQPPMDAHRAANRPYGEVVFRGMRPLSFSAWCTQTCLMVGVNFLSFNGEGNIGWQV